MARLGDLIEQIRGVSYKPEDLCDSLNEDGIPLLRASNIQDGKLNFEDIIYIDKKKVKSNQYLKSGDILVCTSSGSKELVGKAAFVENDLSMTFGAFCKVIRPKICCPKYIGHFFDSPYYRKRISASSAGANINNIRNEHIDEIDIRLPSTDEQKQISAVLDKVSDLISLRKQQLAKLDELVKARFVELFGNVSDFVNITDIAHTYIGLVTTMTKHYCNNGTPLLFNSSIKSDKIVWDGTYLDMEFAEANKSRMHKTNDIVTVHTGDIGTSAVVGEEFNNSLGFATIVTRINDISRYYPRFVSSFLNYGSGKEQLKKYSRDVRNNLNLKDFNRLMVPNVSALEQKRYVDFLEQTDKSKVVVQKALDEAQLLFDSLMQKYFG